MSATNRESDKFMLRLPEGVRDRIKVVADANSRSMNAEIVATLVEKYPAKGSLDDLATALARTFQRLGVHLPTGLNPLTIATDLLVELTLTDDPRALAARLRKEAIERQERIDRGED
jgi:plasmid stability protein